MNSVKLLYAYCVVEFLFCCCLVLHIAVRMRFSVQSEFFNAQYYLFTFFIYNTYSFSFFKKNYLKILPCINSKKIFLFFYLYYYRKLLILLLNKKFQMFQMYIHALQKINKQNQLLYKIMYMQIRGLHELETGLQMKGDFFNGLGWQRRNMSSNGAGWKKKLIFQRPGQALRKRRLIILHVSPG